MLKTSGTHKGGHSAPMIRGNASQRRFLLNALIVKEISQYRRTATCWPASFYYSRRTHILWSVGRLDALKGNCVKCKRVISQWSLNERCSNAMKWYHAFFPLKQLGFSPDDIKTTQQEEQTRELGVVFTLNAFAKCKKAHSWQFLSEQKIKVI